VVVDSGEFNWSNGRFPVIADPSPAYHGLAFHETFGKYGYLTKLRAETLRDLGAALSPFNAFLLAQGIETLPLRMRQHVANAQAVAEFLEGDPRVGRVTYPGLSNNKYKDLVTKYLPEGPGAVFCFDLHGDRETGRRFIEALSLFSHLANVGDAKSLVIHPASTTHRQLNEQELAASGIGPGTIRLSIGIEDAGDLVWDLQQGLNALEATS
jgi:O-acetylhomoserine (thiol)-lyase